MEDIQVGRLALRPDRLCVFEYSEDWVRSGFSISPFHLPLQGGLFTAKHDPFDGLFGVFSDSLPDGWGTLLTDRWLRNLHIDPHRLTCLDRLSLVGTNGMGALSYIPEWGIKNEYHDKDIDQIASVVQRVLNDAGDTDLEKLIRMGESSAGARPKVMVKIEGEDWLVKFPALTDPRDIGHMEYEYSVKARNCGIEMPETRLFCGKYFGVRRFDRGKGKKRPILSAAGLLHASHRFPSLDYISLMKATMALTRDVNESGKMFRLMVFNVLAENRDDHSKNFSFIHDGEQWAVSPAYDLVRSSGFNGFHSTTVAGSGNPGKEDILSVAEESGFPLNKARAIFEEVRERIRD